MTNDYDSAGLDAQQNEGMQTMVIYKRKVVKQPALLESIIVRDAKDDPKPPTPRPAAGTAPTDTEEKVFKRLLDRGEDEHKYNITGKLAEGGMGEVYYSYDKDIDRESILKIILPKHKHNIPLINSFVREARITGQLEHPNIIPVHDLGFLPNYGIFFTMKQVRGESLMDVLRQLEMGDQEYREKYDGYTLLNIFRKVCDAVSYAHSRNILHRDIKPHNIMVGDYGEVLLMDWGLAKKIDDEEPELADEDADDPFAPRNEKTHVGLVKGSPAYMSPEQAAGAVDEIDKSSDIFLLGSTLYHIYTFFPPYLGIDIDDILKQARRYNFVPPEKTVYRNPDLPKEICRIIRRAMAKDKEDRYKTVQDLSQELDDLLRGKMEFNKRLFQAGELLVREGETAGECYIIQRGRVRVFKEVDGKKVELSTLAEGDLVGEMALITQAPRSASVEAMVETEALVLTQELFTHNLKKLPPWMEGAIIALADRLAKGNTKLAAQESHSAESG